MQVVVDLDDVQGTGECSYGYGLEEQLLQQAIAAVPLPSVPSVPSVG